MGSPTNPLLSEATTLALEQYNNIFVTAAPESESTGAISTLNTDYFSSVTGSVVLTQVPVTVISVTSNYNLVNSNLYLISGNTITFVPSLPNSNVVVVYQ